MTRAQTHSKPVVRVGRVRIKGQGSLSALAWRSRPLMLTDDALLCPGYTIPLKQVTKIERVDTKPFCLRLQAKNRTYFLSFENDGELYDWQDDVYSRCPLIGVGEPQGFVHNVHVGFDQMSNSFSVRPVPPHSHSHVSLLCPVIQGLPSQWSALINSGPAVAAAVAGHALPLPLGDSESEKLPIDVKRRSTSDSPALVYAATAPAPAGQKGGRPRSPPVLDGNHSIKVDGLLTGWLWRARWLVLRSKTLTIYRSPRASAGVVIDLGEIRNVESVKPRKLRLETKSGKKYFISFRLAEQATAWRTAIASRLDHAISTPWNFSHNCHVGFDPATGEFTFVNLRHRIPSGVINACAVLVHAAALAAGFVADITLVLVNTYARDGHAARHTGSSPPTLLSPRDLPPLSAEFERCILYTGSKPGLEDKIIEQPPLVTRSGVTRGMS
ncbi:hypothetical protein H0H81_008278 [Sphagnurus paluster]|uniref:Non-specific serine/threonine protein kinase n=1 Tax=Sphagnurus paluster TaxID=117069 RepID=A0A9P7GN34_9AGAR|nr:hypothetical protein H0H81_008278 [Sphagnurus paluster]